MTEDKQGANQCRAQSDIRQENYVAGKRSTRRPKTQKPENPKAREPESQKAFLPAGAAVPYRVSINHNHGRPNVHIRHAMRRSWRGHGTAHKGDKIPHL
jgi:hypothetical protein